MSIALKLLSVLLDVSTSLHFDSQTHFEREGLRFNVSNFSASIHHSQKCVSGEIGGKLESTAASCSSKGNVFPSGQ